MQQRVAKSKSVLVRKQVLLTREQSTRLRALSVASGRPETEIVREALDAFLASRKEETEDWKAGLMSVAGMWADRTDLDEVFARARMSWDRDFSTTGTPQRERSVRRGKR